MKIALIVPVLNQLGMFEKCWGSWMYLAAQRSNLDLLVIDNGSSPPVRSIWPSSPSPEPPILRLEHNVGVLRALQEGYRLLSRTGLASDPVVDWFLFTHSDVEMLETSWDVKLASVLAKLERPGVVGLFGHRQVGSQELYSSPYHPGRLSKASAVCSAPSMGPHGGRKPYQHVVAGIDCEEVAALDGYMLCCSRAFLDENHGFDQGLPAHHMYDTHTCLQARELGYRNYVVGIDAHHHGGATDSNENWAEPMGTTKQAVWEEAHRYVYDYWHPSKGRRTKLPFRI